MNSVGTAADGAPIIPISAVLNYNIDVISEYLVTQIAVPKRNFTVPPQMIIIRSFDVNKPGEEIENLQGGVAGGSILYGVLKVNDEIEVRPGIISKDQNGQITCTSIKSRYFTTYPKRLNNVHNITTISDNFHNYNFHATIVITCV